MGERMGRNWPSSINPTTRHCPSTARTRAVSPASRTGGPLLLLLLLLVTVVVVAASSFLLGEVACRRRRIGEGRG